MSFLRTKHQITHKSRRTFRNKTETKHRNSLKQFYACFNLVSIFYSHDDEKYANEAETSLKLFKAA